MKIELNRLADPDEMSWYTAKVEKFVGRLLVSEAANVHPHLESVNLHQSWAPELTQGHHFGFDFKIANATFELKCSKNKLMKFEVVDKGKPSGLNRSQADFYIMINEGSSKVGNDWVNVNKLRIISTHNARHIITTQEIPYQYSEQYQYGFYELDPKTDFENTIGRDGWLADLSLEDSSIIKANHNLIRRLPEMFMLPHNF